MCLPSVSQLFLSLQMFFLFGKQTEIEYLIEYTTYNTTTMLQLVCKPFLHVIYLVIKIAVS
jgi:hypothetical protein